MKVIKINTNTSLQVLMKTDNTGIDLMIEDVFLSFEDIEEFGEFMYRLRDAFLKSCDLIKL